MDRPTPRPLLAGLLAGLFLAFPHAGSAGIETTGQKPATETASAVRPVPVPVPVPATSPVPTARPGGVRVAPPGRVRVECWQNGTKIIDEEDLSVAGIGLPNQVTGMTFNRADDGSGMTSLYTASRTACRVKQDGGRRPARQETYRQGLG
jgi:hypothetical protein